MDHLSDKASAILARKDENWEHFLTFEILEPEIDRILREYQNLQKRPRIASTVLGGEESLVFCDRRIAELHESVPKLADLLNVTLREAWGRPDEDGDAVAIIEACRQILAICEAFLDWERSFRTTALHSDCGQFSKKAPGMTKDYLEEIRRALGVLRSEAEKPGRDGVVKITGNFDDKQIRGVTFGAGGQPEERNTLLNLLLGFLFGRFVLGPLLWLLFVTLFWICVLVFLFH